MCEQPSVRGGWTLHRLVPSVHQHILSVVKRMTLLQRGIYFTLPTCFLNVLQEEKIEIRVYFEKKTTIKLTLFSM